MWFLVRCWRTLMVWVVPDEALRLRWHDRWDDPLASKDSA